jgi:hypothetical protein
MGLPPVRLHDLREHVRICRALLRGEEVLYREGKHERWIHFMHPDRGINIKQSISIHARTWTKLEPKVTRWVQSPRPSVAGVTDRPHSRIVKQLSDSAVRVDRVH